VVATTRGSVSRQRRKLKMDPFSRAAYLLNSITCDRHAGFQEMAGVECPVRPASMVECSRASVLMALGKISPGITLKDESAVHG
jgi:hypothetical protein